MTVHSRTMAAIVFAGAAMTSLLLAQGPTPAPQGQAPAGQPPTEQGRGDPGRGAGPGGGRQGGRGGRAGGFTQFTRELAPQDVIVRGKCLYEANCASCHAADLRGTADGQPNLLRSGIALSDQHGELIGPALASHTPAITLVAADSVAVAEYIHSIHATMGGQGSPPGRNPTGHRAQRPRRRREGGRGLLRGRLLDVSFGDRRSEGHRREIPRRAGAAERLGRGIERRASAAADAAAAAGAGNPGDRHDGRRLEDRRHARAQGRLARRS